LCQERGHRGKIPKEKMPEKRIPEKRIPESGYQRR
jgi:hypothetical protein